MRGARLCSFRRKFFAAGKAPVLLGFSLQTLRDSCEGLQFAPVAVLFELLIDKIQL